MAKKIIEHGELIKSITCDFCKCKFRYNVHFDVELMSKSGNMIRVVKCPECQSYLVEEDIRYKI